MQDPELRVGTLSNGLTYYIRSNPYPAKRANLWLSVNAGSINEDEDQRGFAHFLEHMAFNGTTNFPGNAAIDFIERSGMTFGADLNAYTGFEETVFQLTIPTDDTAMFVGGLQIIDDWANGRILMDSSEVTAERGVVLGEWRVRLPDTSAMRYQMDKLTRMYGQGSIFAKRLPIGAPELLEVATPAPIKRFYRDWYRPDLMAVIMVGDFDASVVEQEIVKRFSDMKMPVNPRKFEQPIVKPSSGTIVHSLVDKAYPSVELTWLATPLAADPATELRQRLLDQLSTYYIQRAFSALSKKERRAFVGASFGRVDGYTRKSQDRMILQLAASPDSLMGAFRIALTEVERVAQYGIADAVLARDKEILLRRYVSQSDGSMSMPSRSYADMYSHHFLTGEGNLLSPDQTLGLVRSILPTITPNEVATNVRGWRNVAGRIVTVNQPFGYPTAKIPTADIKSLLREVASKKLTIQSPADGLLGSPTNLKDEIHPAIATKPNSGTVLSTEHFINAGLTEWKLSNGARVVYKRNVSQPDNFLITAYSLGGSSVMHDSLFTSPGRLVGLLMTASGGFQGVNREMVQQETRKTGLNEFRVELNTFDEEVVIGGSPRELEYLFQTLYLQFTAPMVDTLAMADWRRNGMSEGFMSSNDRQALQAGRHRRLVGPSLVNVPFVDLAQAMRVYKDRFGDASDFTFYIVGPSDPNDILPMVTEYIASLPSTHRKEREVPRDFKIPVSTRKFEGTQTHPGLLPEQSAVSLGFSGKLPADSIEYLNAMQELNSASWILGRRLRNLLREEMAVTYSVGAPYVQYWTPDPRYSVSVSVIVDTAMMDTTAKSILGVVDEFRTNGPTDEELQMAVSVRNHQLENARQDNGWWINRLQTLDRVGMSYDYLEKNGNGITLTKERVRDAANKYFPKKMYVLQQWKPIVSKKPPVKKDSTGSAK